MTSSSELSADFREWNAFNGMAKFLFSNPLVDLVLNDLLFHAEEHQEKFLKKMLYENKSTEFGKKYSFETLENYSAFKKHVPVSHYEDFYDSWIERMLKGEQNLTISSDIFVFARTGGTTSKKEKYVPLTKDSLRENQTAGPSLLLAFYQGENPDSKLFTGKIITIGGGFTTNPFTGEKNVGFISGILQKQTPTLIKLFKEPSEEISFLTNWDEKVQQIVETTKGKNITGIAGIPLWCSHIFKEILHATGKASIHEVWPNFEVFLTGGTWFEPYREEFDSLWDREKVTVWQSYNSSEGFFAVQMKNGADDMLLLTNHGVFYEFIPVEEYHSVISGVSKKSLSELTLPLHKVKKQKEYVLLITTNAGLWRYVLGDTIKFTGKDPYTIQITGRTKFFIDAFNEHTLLDHTDKAIKFVEEEFSCKIKEYSVAANIEKKCYEWVIEFSKQPNNFKSFEKVLDVALQQANDNYRAKRVENGGVQQGIVHIGSDGTFERWFSQAGRSGGQSKVPKLSMNMSVIEDLMNYL